MEAVFMHLLDIGITAGFVVLGVLLLRLLFKKAPKWIVVLLWAFVAVRLILPFSFESVLSIVPDIDVPVAQSSQSDTSGNMTYTHPATGQEIEIITEYDEVVDDFGLGNDAALIPAGDTDSGVSVTPAQLATAVWLCGVVGMTVYAAMSYILLYRRVRTATRLRDNIYQSDAVGSPFVLGIIRPRIYLPYTLSEAHLDSVLAHEQSHIKRGDHIIKPLGFLLLTVYWFQPLLWVAYVLLCRDIELACDEKAIKTLSEEERRGYSMALLESAVGRRRIAACPLAFGEVAVSSRIQSVMSYKKPAFWVIIIAVIVGLIAGAMLLTDRPEGKTYGEPDASFDGALLTVERVDSSHKQTFELKREDDGTYRRKKILDGTTTPIYFYITDINEEAMTVSVGMNKPLLLDGEEVSEVIVPCSRYTLLTQTVDGKKQYYVLRMKFPTALDNEPLDMGAELNDRVVRRYVGDGYTLMLYTRYFRLVKGDILSYNPEDSVEADKVMIEELSDSVYSQYLYGENGAVFTENQALGVYEFTDDGRLILTEDGGLTRYVFEVSEDGSRLSHIKGELARHKEAISPILKNEKLTCDYTCTIDAHPLNVCDYVITDGKGNELLTGESITKDLTLTVFDKTKLRVEAADRHSDHHKRTLQNIDLETGECSDVFSHVVNTNDKYIVFLSEEDGKVFVNADLSFTLMCGTPPVPQTLHVELEGLSSLADTKVFGDLDDDELVVWYLDDNGEEHVIARRLEGGVMWGDDHQGEKITRPLIVIESDDPSSGEYCRHESDRSLYYGGVARVYIRINREYRSLESLLTDRDMTITQFEDFVKTDVDKKKAEIIATYRDGGTWVVKYNDADDAHTIYFHHTLDGDDDVYIGSDERDDLTWKDYYADKMQYGQDDDHRYVYDPNETMSVEKFIAEETGEAQTPLGYVKQYYAQKQQNGDKQDYWYLQFDFTCPVADRLLGILRLDEWEEAAIDPSSTDYKDQRFFHHTLQRGDGKELVLYIGDKYGAIEVHNNDTMNPDEVVQDGVYFTLPQEEEKGLVKAIADYANELAGY